MHNYYIGQLIKNDSDLINSNIILDSNKKIQFLAKSPGEWGNSITIAVAIGGDQNNSANNGDFNQSKEVFAGILLDDVFDYIPQEGRYGIIIKYKDAIVESFTVSLNVDERDSNGKSVYIDDVINNNSDYIFCIHNSSDTRTLPSLLNEKAITLLRGVSSNPTEEDLLKTYDLFSNKEEVDIDIIIANELDGGASAVELVNARKDCLVFIGANYEDVVNVKDNIAINNLISWVSKTPPSGKPINYNNMFVVACGNYKYQYDRYNDKYRWVNIAGDIAGLRAFVSENNSSGEISAGIKSGQIKNVTKLAFNPTQGQRDLLYKNSINPIVSFPGQGTVMWGQKTLLDQPSSFDRVNVRGLFNTLERALGKMAKFQIMKFNDNFTRNRIISMIKPYLSSVQAGRGIQDFLVICDESNNTPDIISRNKLIVDIYIKPTFVAEFIQLLV